MAASLTSLPNELLFMICNELHPVPGYSHGGLHALNALSRANRRLFDVFNPILYDRGVKCHSHLPLLWAAKFNVPATLTAALAAGADPNYSFRAPISLDVWALSNDAHRANRDWSNGEPTYWPPMDQWRDSLLDGSDRRWAREMTPTLTQLDIVAATSAIPTTSQSNAAPEPGDGQSDPPGLGDDESGSDSDSSLGSDASSREDMELLGNPHLTGWGNRQGMLPAGDGPDGYLMRSYTALHVAAKEGHSDIVDMLLDNGAFIDSLCRWFCGCRTPRALWRTLVARDRDPWAVGGPGPSEYRNQTPLHVAICASRIEIAKLLVSRGARVVHNFACASTAAYGALHQAAAAGYADLVERILDSHPEVHVDEADEQGLTAFYYASAHGRWDSTVPLLLARGANINLWFEVHRANESLKTTPLGEFCRLGRFGDALRLIDLGADITLGILLDRRMMLSDDPDDDEDPDYVFDLSPQRRTIFDVHVSLLHLCCIDFRDRRRYPHHESIWGPARLQTHLLPKLIARLVAGGLSPDSRYGRGTESAGDTPLSLATKHLNIAAIKALRDAGANANARGDTERTPLMCVVQLPDPEDGYHGMFPHEQPYAGRYGNDCPDRWAMARLLLDAGARMNDQDKEGNTVLHLLFLAGDDYASPWSRMDDDPARRQLLRLLLVRGADPCSRNRSGKSVLRLAVEKAEVEAVEMMALQCDIDLEDQLPTEEVFAIFAAVPWQDENIPLGPTRPLGSTDGFDLDEDYAAASRLTDALLSMHLSGGASVRLLHSGRDLMDSKQRASAAAYIDLFCLRGLENGFFPRELKRDMLPITLEIERWWVAYELLKDLPEVPGINEPIYGGQTLLSLVTSSTFHCAYSPSLDIQLVEAGADVHLGTGTLLLTTDDTGAGTPLKEALMYPDAFHIDWMLHKQPIRENPQAAAARYLHWAVTLPWRRDLPLRFDARLPAVSWAAREDSLRSLLAAGADTTQLDNEGNTPLSLLLLKLDNDVDQLRYMCHWFKPLSRGVDVNQPNKKGMSVGDYLDKILSQPPAAKMLSVYLKLVPLEGGKWEIKWLK